MAQGGVGRAFVSRCLRSPISGGHCRPFSSSSPSQRELVPTFTPTSSPELDALLEKFRTKLFIPMSLSEQYRKIVYSPKKSEVLKTSPVAVTVNPGQSDEEFMLEPLTRNELRKDDTVKVLQGMKTREDWRNFIPFLTGLANSRHPLAAGHLERAIRKAGERGMARVILDAAAQVSRTQLSLGNINLAIATFRAFRHQAQEAGFKGEGLASAVRLARQAAWLMNEPAHMAPRGHADPKLSPTITGVLLELNAAHALDATEKRDVDGYVKMYSKIAHANYKTDIHEIPSLVPEVNQKLWQMVSFWHGIKLALQVQEIRDDPTLTEALTLRMKKLATKIEIAEKKVEGTKFLRKGNRYGLTAVKMFYRGETA